MKFHFAAAFLLTPACYNNLRQPQRISIAWLIYDKMHTSGNLILAVVGTA
jgi:hypothetical protein